MAQTLIELLNETGLEVESVDQLAVMVARGLSVTLIMNHEDYPSVAVMKVDMTFDDGDGEFGPYLRLKSGTIPELSTNPAVRCLKVGCFGKNQSEPKPRWYIYDVDDRLQVGNKRLIYNLEVTWHQT
ncbi:hypothetical protein H6778_03260 [Candidatus Nomurabacteria bacterium]|nr:hypothetical protein [Candidatus Nomurabacteria bacterium]